MSLEKRLLLTDDDIFVNISLPQTSSENRIYNNYVIFIINTFIAINAIYIHI